MQFTLKLRFAVPLDAGAEFVWVCFEERRGGMLGKLRAEVVFAVNGGPVYGDGGLSAVLCTALEKHVASPDVLQMFAAVDYVIVEQRRGRCVRSFVTTSSPGTTNARVETTLLCEAIA